MAEDPRSLLSSALSLWWLRPENGLAIASYILYGYNFAPKAGQCAADFACGDGVNTFFKAGGRFDPEFDIFGSAVRHETANQVVGQSIDVFDHFDDSYGPKTVKRPSERFRYGTDRKSNLLQKARALDYYVDLLEVDLAEEPAIEDESLDIAYCNSLYWIAQPEVAVKHIYRKLKPNGIGVFDVMTTHRRALHFQNLFPTLPADWHDLMNRGRDRNNPGLRSGSDWRALIAACGDIVIEDERDIFPSAIAQAWNFGLRPLFPVLNRMASGLSLINRKEIKAEWVEIWTRVLLPLLVDPAQFSNNGARVRLQYVVRKR
ncbi:methyltransferase domain-containing protein [Pelagibius sp.]|uniref:methyltransferase domain-containing protein n=1 Tax=Pelagibius sp. TaxID=1931238 RepID=UPI003B50E465